MSKQVKKMLSVKIDKQGNKDKNVNMEFMVNSPNINEHVLMLKKLSFISMIGKCFFHL